MPILPLTRVLSEFAPAYYDDWPDFIEKSLANPLEADRIFNLAIELLERGAFDRPVTLLEEDPDPDPEYSTPAQVGNGMHRLAAHVLTGVERVEVQFGPMYGTDWSVPTTTLYFATSNDSERDEWWENLMSLASYRDPEGDWIENVYLGKYEGVYHLMFDTDCVGAMPNFIQRLRDNGFAVTWWGAANFPQNEEADENDDYPSDLFEAELRRANNHAWEKPASKS